MQLLCGIDDGQPALRAARVASNLACGLRASLTFCMVNALMPGRGPPIQIWPDEYVAEILDRVCRRAVFWGVRNVRTETWRARSVSAAIAAYADDKGVDLIVVGSYESSGLARVLSGSVSRELLRIANCPVLVVKRVREENSTRGQGGRPVSTLFPTPCDLPAAEVR